MLSFHTTSHLHADPLPAASVPTTGGERLARCAQACALRWRAMQGATLLT